MRALLSLCLLSAGGCHAAMVQQSLGATSGFTSGRHGGTASLSFAISDRTGGIGGTGRIVVTEDVALVTDEIQLVAIGRRRGAFRPYGRVGFGFNLGSVEGDFGGGGVISGELGAVFGRRGCGWSIHAGASYLGRMGDGDNVPFVGIELGRTCVHHDGD